MSKYEIPSRSYAALKWKKFPKELPQVDQTVLVCTNTVSLIPDVAVYRGLDDGGSHRFILSDIELTPSSIIVWTEIQLPALIVK